MSGTLDRVKACVARRAVRLSDHGAEQMAVDDISLRDILASVSAALLVENYPDAVRGPSVLALHRERDGRPVHVVWAFRKATTEPAVLVTSWRPDPLLWSADFLTRKR